MLSCSAAANRTAVCNVVKYMYWKNHKTNLPVYLIPDALKHKVLMKKERIGSRKARFCS